MNTNELNLINRDLAKIELKSQGCNPEESTKSGRTYRPQSLSKSEAAKMAEFSSKTIDSVMSLYNKAIDPQIKPDQATPYTSLPKYVRTFIHVGLATLKDRTVSLLMNSENFKLLNNSRADAIAEQLKKSIESSEMKSQVFTKEAFNEKGMTLQVPMKKSEPVSLSLGMNPQISINYQKAIVFAEKHLLNNAEIFSSSSENDLFLRVIIQINKLILQGLSGTEEKDLGKFRKKFMLVYNGEIAPLDDIEITVKKFGSKEEISLFESIKQKVTKANENTHKTGIVKETKTLYTEEFTKEEKALWDKFCAPSPDQVMPKMKEFSKNLKFYFNHPDIHPLALGAWTHSEIVSIHPFLNGNGRTARLVMHCILALKGYLPLVFVNDGEYNDAFGQNLKKPGYFAEYLSQKVLPLTRSKAKDLLATKWE